mmetsp:Transcript_52297/g.89831  ORF Transcript_52297/g.89831 Transcript_52297/m.89831 type:complete len:80 (+) Transcript_52297:86-325(+)
MPISLSLLSFFSSTRPEWRHRHMWTQCAWFATPVEIGPNGMTKNLGLGELDAFEKVKLGEAVTELVPSIVEGVAFVKNA